MYHYGTYPIPTPTHAHIHTLSTRPHTPTYTPYAHAHTHALARACVCTAALFRLVFNTRPSTNRPQVCSHRGQGGLGANDTAAAASAPLLERVAALAAAGVSCFDLDVVSTSDGGWWGKLRRRGGGWWGELRREEGEGLAVHARASGCAWRSIIPQRLSGVGCKDGVIWGGDMGWGAAMVAVMPTCRSYTFHMATCHARPAGKLVVGYGPHIAAALHQAGRPVKAGQQVGAEREGGRGWRGRGESGWEGISGRAFVLRVCPAGRVSAA